MSMKEIWVYKRLFFKPIFVIVQEKRKDSKDYAYELNLSSCINAELMLVML